jgi:hypothetical protein
MQLSDLYVGTSFFQLVGDFFGSSLVNAFLNSLRSTVYEVFRLFQAQASQVLNDLHYVQFRSTTALQDNIEGGLLFCNSSSAAAITRYHNSSCCGLDAVFRFQEIGQLLYFFNGQANQLFCEIFYVCHDLKIFSGFISPV